MSVNKNVNEDTVQTYFYKKGPPESAHYYSPDLFPESKTNLKEAQQPTKSCKFLPQGSIVLWKHGQTSHICLVNREPKLDHRVKIYQMQVLDSDKTRQAPKEHLKKLGYGTALQKTLDENQILARYWYHRLEHLPLICLVSLGIRNILPYGISTVTTLPLYPD